MKNDHIPENDSSAAESNSNKNQKTDSNQPLPFHNPLKPGDDKQITQEDIENEQKYKEALSERD